MDAFVQQFPALGGGVHKSIRALSTCFDLLVIMYFLNQWTLTTTTTVMWGIHTSFFC